MIGPNEKRKWVVLGMLAVLLLALSGLGGDGRHVLAPPVSAAQAPAGSEQPVGPAAASTGALVHSLVFPAFALASDPASTIVTRTYDGLRWKFQNAAVNLVMPRPPDWDGTSAIQIRMLFKPMTSTSGTVQFFVRPRVYDPGDSFRDVPGIASELVPVSIANQCGQMSISIPAARFGTKSWWYLVFQRDITTATYPDDVVILSVAIQYNALSPLSSVAVPVVRRQE
jgi:hypothetical protein